MTDMKLNPGVYLSEQKGRRVPDNEWFELRDRGALEPGDYGLVTGEEPRPQARCAFEGCTRLAHVRVCAPAVPTGPSVCLCERHEPFLAVGYKIVVYNPVETAEAREPTTGWYARCPNGVDVNLSPCHPVTVQEDGTVSVSGSILAGDWHGWLCRGVWRQA